MFTARNQAEQMDRSALALAAPPRTSLAFLPTPLVAAPRLTAALEGPQIWIKRDDLTGLGLGGNKVRGLEFFLADALAQHADTLVTGGGPQSNHVRATAAAAARTGLAMVAIYCGSPSGRVEGNERLTRLLGAEVQYTGEPDRASVDRRIDDVVANLRSSGRRPYAIPRGGASPLGVLGYVWAARELAEQCAACHLTPQAVFLATGSGGTQAGLLAGCRALALPWRVEGFTVSRTVHEAHARVLALAHGALERLHLAPSISSDDVIVHDGVIGAGYGIPTRAGAAAIRRVAETEGIFLDPTYTGKAVAGLMAHIQDGRLRRDETIIFVHTGGEPALLAGDGSWLAT
jgi:D-cysteine desulfhydrase family pyridoxal phosphate-dependent enzyme